MANPKHLKILKQGVDTWAKWREDHPETLPDLAAADLVRADLENANLANADLSDAVLNSAVLQQANLENAYLLNARLDNARLERINLKGAILAGTSLRGANLSDANLSGARLWLTNLAQANLMDANFSNASMGYSFFEFVDLSTAKGLETVSFTGPLSIGVETLYMSEGRIAVVFLRDAGVPENLIAELPRLTGKAFDFHTCFISFAEPDAVFAQKLRNDLQSAGVRCWLWKEDARMGHDIFKSIDAAIKEYDKLIMICSANSLNSPAVLREIERALQKEDALVKQGKKSEVLFPIRLDDYVISGWDHHRQADLVRKNIGDFRNWRTKSQYQKAFGKLLDAINKQLDA